MINLSTIIVCLLLVANTSLAEDKIPLDVRGEKIKRLNPNSRNLETEIYDLESVHKTAREAWKQVYFSTKKRSWIWKVDTALTSFFDKHIRRGDDTFTKTHTCLPMYFKKSRDQNGIRETTQYIIDDSMTPGQIFMRGRCQPNWLTYDDSHLFEYIETLVNTSPKRIAESSKEEDPTDWDQVKIKITPYIGNERVIGIPRDNNETYNLSTRSEDTSKNGRADTSSVSIKPKNIGIENGQQNTDESSNKQENTFSRSNQSTIKIVKIKADLYYKIEIEATEYSNMGYESQTISDSKFTEVIGEAMWDKEIHPDIEDTILEEIDPRNPTLPLASQIFDNPRNEHFNQQLIEQQNMNQSMHTAGQ